MRIRLKDIVITLVVVVAGWAAVGCSGDVVNSYSDYSSLPSYGWTYTDVRQFNVTHRDSVCSGTLVVGLRHNGDYPYTDIQLGVEYSDGDNLRHDTLTVALSDSFGKWIGNGVGYSFQVTDTVGRIRHHISGRPVRVRHLMRCDTLPGISQIGVFFIP